MKNDELMVVIKDTIMDKSDQCKRNIQKGVKGAIQDLVSRGMANSGPAIVIIGNVHKDHISSFFNEVYDYLIQIQQDQNVKLSDEEFAELEKVLHGHCIGLLTGHNREINDYSKQHGLDRLPKPGINDGVEEKQKEISKMIERLKILTHNRKDPPELITQKYSNWISIAALIIAFLALIKAW